MKIYQNPFRCDEHCVPKNTYFFIFYYKIITFLQKCQNIAQIFLFRVSRNCEIFAQISISCLAKFREIRRKFRRNFRETTKSKIFLTTRSVWANLENIFSRLCPFNLHTQSIHDLWNCLKQLALRQCSFFGELMYLKYIKSNTKEMQNTNK